MTTDFSEMLARCVQRSLPAYHSAAQTANMRVEKKKRQFMPLHLSGAR